MRKPTFAWFFSSWGGPLVLLLVAILAFGLMLPGLGFYWDDWAKILVSRLYGLSAYPAYYAEDRPLSAWTHMLFTPLLGESPLPWQVFTLLLRWLSALSFWWCLGLIWPWARRQNLVAALLFLVYPVFTQQPAAVTFHQQWLQYLLFFLSLGAMMLAVRARQARQRWLWTALSLGASLLQLTVTEYFAPIELVRPLVLWFILPGEAALSSNPRGWISKSGRVLRAWLPYLILLGAYTVFRLFLLRLPGNDPYSADTLYDFIADPLKTAWQMLLVMLVDEQRILVGVWADLLHIGIVGATRAALLSYGVAVITGGLLFVYLLRTADSQTPGAPDEECQPQWSRQAFLLGLAGVLLGPVPAWITGRQVVFDFHSDRYALPAMFGAALLLAAGIEWLSQRKVQRTVLAVGLVTLAIGLQLRAANDYRWIWTAEQRFFWQLAWRAPGLKAPTAIFLETELFPNQGLFSTSAALNQMYPQGLEPFSTDRVNRLSYWIYTLRPRYREKPDDYTIKLNTTFRTLHFEGQTPDSLLVYSNPARSNCLWVLSARDANNPYLPQLVRDFLPISNLERILPESTPGFPPVDMIGPEPPRAWCYYF
ncbi:MAG: hypothetical protein EHM21_10360, partial [Chloroflexi bacterium]